MGEENSVGVDMKKLDEIVMLDDAATTSLGESFGRQNLPVVVGVIVAVPSHLLACHI